ncbi:MAG: 2-dehydropantoate 2-reductase [Ignavibacteriales bacterium]|nr:2-dehydropantoate 2-reductase [Ignavibacteriales bacterium]
MDSVFRLNDKIENALLTNQMLSSFKIAILGVGAIGGYFGGKLAAQYANSDDVEIIFIARGENEKAIRTNGLKLITAQGEHIIRPSLVTSKPEQVGVVDFVLCCVKSYDLETSIAPLKPCISDKTIILPLLYGVDASERIKKLFPQANVWDGCVYIVSRLIAPGVVEEKGSMNSLYFGSSRLSGTKETLQQVETIFRTANVNARISENIVQTLWEKFLFISPFATLTSFLNTNIGGIMSNEQHKELLFTLLLEVKAIADAKKISLSDNVVEKTMEQFAKLPAETTSSMHSDFQKGKQTELEALTTYVVEQGNELNVATPNYERMLKGLGLESYYSNHKPQTKLFTN